MALGSRTQLSPAALRSWHRSAPIPLLLGKAPCWRHSINSDGVPINSNAAFREASKRSKVQRSLLSSSQAAYNSLPRTACEDFYGSRVCARLLVYSNLLLETAPDAPDAHIIAFLLNKIIREILLLGNDVGWFCLIKMGYQFGSNCMSNWKDIGWICLILTDYFRWFLPAAHPATLPNNT